MDESFKFGLSRRQPDGRNAITPIVGRYAFFADRFRGRDDVIPTPHPFPHMPGNLAFPLQDEIDGKPITLTTVFISTLEVVDRRQPPFANFAGRGARLSEPFHIVHTSAEDVPRVMAHAQKLFAEAIKPSITDNEALELMASIHWWLANAMPDERGSAAKSEWVVRAIGQARGMELPPFRQGFVADLEAMSSPRKEFIAKYAASLEWSQASVIFG